MPVSSGTLPSLPKVLEGSLPRGSLRSRGGRRSSVSGTGDYNGNGVVDAADYVVWRKGLGTTFTQTHYEIWRTHFGQSAGSAVSLASVPEPASFTLPASPHLRLPQSVATKTLPAFDFEPGSLSGQFRLLIRSATFQLWDGHSCLPSICRPRTSM